MAGLADYSAQIQPEGLPGRPYPHFPADITPSETGAAVGEGIEHAGDVANQIANRAQAFARMTQIQDQDNLATAKVADLTHNPDTGALTLKGKDAIGLDQKYLPQFDQWAAQQLSGISDPKVRQAVKNRLDEQRTGLRNTIDTHEINEQARYGQQTAQAGIELAINAAGLNYNHPDVIEQHFRALQSSSTNLSHQLGESDESAVQRMQVNVSKFHQAVIAAALADHHPDLAQVYYEHAVSRGELDVQQKDALKSHIDTAHAGDLADKIMGVYRGAGMQAGEKAYTAIDTAELPDYMKDLVRKDVRSRLGLLQEEARQKAGPQLEAIGEAMGRGNAGLNEISSIKGLMQSGAVQFEQGGMMIGHIQKQMQKDAELQANVAAFGAAVTGNGPKLDPKHVDQDTKDAADKYFTDQTRGLQPFSQGWNNEVALIAQNSNIIPPAAQSMMRVGLTSQDPGTVAAASEAFERVQKANEFADVYEGDKRAEVKAHSIAMAAAATGDVKSVVERWQEYEKKGSAEKKFLDERWGDDKGNKAETWAPALAQELKGDARYAGAGPMPPQLISQFQELTRQYYNTNGGQMKDARDLAARAIKRTWRTTTVNGTTEYMQYAPEARGVSSDEVREDITAMFGGGAQYPGRTQGGNIDLRNVGGGIHTLDYVVPNQPGISGTPSGVPAGGEQHVLIPSQDKGGRELSRDEAIAQYQKSGRHYGKFADTDSADRFATVLRAGGATGEVYRNLYPAPLAPNIDPAKVRIASDTQTEAEGGRSYALQYPDEHGFYDKLTYPSGEPIRYTPPSGNARMEAERKRLGEQGMTKLQAYLAEERRRAAEPGAVSMFGERIAGGRVAYQERP